MAEPNTQGVSAVAKPNAEGGTERAVIAAFVGNFAIGLTKLFAAIVTGSGSMLAETAHSFADATNQILLFVGIRRSAGRPTEKHPLGYGKERYFWALVVALFLFFGGGVFALYEAYSRFTDPHELGDVTIAFVVLGLSMVFEAFSISVAIKEVRHAAHEAGLPVRQFLRELRDPALRTVLYEDSAAMLGLVIAAIGLFLTVQTHDHRFDAGGSAAIGLLLIGVAYQLARDARALIIGEAAPEGTRNAIRATLTEHADVEEVLELLAIRVGAKQLLVLARLSARDDLTGADVERLLVTLRGRIRERHPEVLESFLEVNPGAAAVRTPSV